MNTKFALMPMIFIGLFAAESLGAAEFIQSSAAEDGSSIQVQLSEQDLTQKYVLVRAEWMQEFAYQELQPPTLTVTWNGGQETYSGPQWWREEVVYLEPLRAANTATLELQVSFPQPNGFRLELAHNDVWAEYRLKGDEGWVFSRPAMVTDVPVWDTQMTEWNQDLTLFLPPSMTEQDTVVVAFAHSENSFLANGVIIGVRDRDHYYLTMDQNGRLAIPMTEILSDGPGSVGSMIIQPSGFGGQSGTGWIWYTATIAQTGQTAIAVHSGYWFNTWYADHKPADPAAWVLDTAYEKTAIQVTSWGQVKAGF